MSPLQRHRDRPGPRNHLQKVDETTGLSSGFYSHFDHFTSENGFEKILPDCLETEHIFNSSGQQRTITITLKLDLFVREKETQSCIQFSISGWFLGSPISSLTAGRTIRGRTTRNSEGRLLLEALAGEMVAVDRIEVSTKFEGLGIGRRMVQMLHEKAKAVGVTMSTVRPGTFRDDGEKNLAADGRARSVVFWEKMGYEVDTTIQEKAMPRRLKML